MRPPITRWFPFLNLAAVSMYLLSIFAVTNKEVNEKLNSFNDFLNKGGQWRKLASNRQWTIIPKRNNTPTSSTMNDGVEKEVFYILDWTSFYGLPMTDDYLIQGCPQLPCRVTTDRRMIRHSAAVVFHPPDLRFLDWPLWRSPFQSYVLALWESPTTVIDVGWTYLRWYANWYNLTMTYRYDSDIPTPYGHLERLRTRKNERKFDEELRRMVANKTKLVAWFVSHCSTRSERERFAAELQKYVPVDIYGDCGKLTCPRNNCDERRLLGQYKFYLSFENSICKDYITEKFYDRLLLDVVPVVLGGAGNFIMKNDDQFPEHGFIAAANFSSIKALADYLLYLDSHPEEYAKYFRWKLDYEAIMSWTRTFERSYCQLCRRLMWIRDDFERRRQSYADMYYWYHEKYRCDDNLVRRYLNGV